MNAIRRVRVCITLWNNLFQRLFSMSFEFLRKSKTLLVNLTVQKFNDIFKDENKRKL